MAVRKIRWFRVYDDLVDDPKVQRLPCEQFRALVNLWCLASENGGTLPDREHIGFKLRITAVQVDRLLDALTAGGLLDVVGDEVAPHNWKARQFKSDADPTAAERAKRHRDNKRNVTPASRVTQHPPESETETEKKDAASAAPELPLPIGRPPPTLRVVEERIDEPEKALFDRGKQVLGQNAGGQIRKLLNAKGGKIPLARAAIEQASTKQNPREYIARAIIGPDNEVDAREEARLIEAWKTKHKRAVVFDTDRPGAIAEMLADRASAVQ